MWLKPMLRWKDSVFVQERIVQLVKWKQMEYG